LRAIREARKATHRIFDPEARRMIEVPDHKTRLAAVALMLACDEGLPIRREVMIGGDSRSADDVLKVFRSSPEGMRTLRALSGVGAGLEVDGQVIEVGDLSGVQKTGS